MFRQTTIAVLIALSPITCFAQTGNQTPNAAVTSCLEVVNEKYAEGYNTGFSEGFTRACTSVGGKPSQIGAADICRLPQVASGQSGTSLVGSAANVPPISGGTGMQGTAFPDGFVGIFTSQGRQLADPDCTSLISDFALPPGRYFPDAPVSPDIQTNGLDAIRNMPQVEVPKILD